MILYINCCPRTESRTKKISEALLDKLGAYEEVNLYEENLMPLNRERLDYRTKKIDENDYEDSIFSYAKQFAAADVIVIAAPFWDLSFPAQLKIYLENIYVTGIVSEYGEDGMPRGLCNAKKLYYVTTAGGPYNGKYSYDYINDMAVNYFGIGETQLIKAEMLDVVGFDADAIIADVIENINI